MELLLTTLHPTLEVLEVDTGVVVLGCAEVVGVVTVDGVDGTVADPVAVGIAAAEDVATDDEPPQPATPTTTITSAADGANRPRRVTSITNSPVLSPINSSEP